VYEVEDKLNWPHIVIDALRVSLPINRTNLSESSRYYKGGGYNNRFTAISNADAKPTGRVGEVVYIREEYRRITRLHGARVSGAETKTVLPQMYSGN